MGLMSWVGRGTVLVTGLVLAGQLAAQDLIASPTGDVVLTITGRITAQNVNGAALLDIAMLEAMDPVEFTTHTIWTDGVQTFRGVALAELMSRLGAEGTVIAASALNDYTVEIPMSDAVEGGPILAFKQNGVALSVRDKGPLWLVYPYDDDPDYQTEVIYARSIWQLARIDVR